MKKVKITVIKCGLNQKLIDKYVQGNIDPCSYNIEGITFISNGWQKPFGLCDNAWKSMMEYVFTLLHGGGNFYNCHKNSNSFIASCNDGLRPVCYLLEVMDEEVTELFENQLLIKKL